MLSIPSYSSRLLRLSLELDRSARLFELLLDRLGLGLRHALLDRLGRPVDQVLGLLEAEPGDLAHHLDDLDLLVARPREDDREVLLLGCGRRRRLEEPQELRQQHLARGQRRERLHLGRRQHLPIEQRASDLELGELLGELDRQLRDRDRVLEAEDQRQRAPEHRPELLVTRRRDRAPGERVLRYPAAALRLAHRAPEAVHLSHRETAVLRQHGHRRPAEVVLPLAHAVDLLCPPHAPVLTRRPARSRGRCGCPAPWWWRPPPTACSGPWRTPAWRAAGSRAALARSRAGAPRRSCASRSPRARCPPSRPGTRPCPP